jgi:hypothetical protein
MAYTRADRGSKLLFEKTREGLLRVSDADRYQKRPLIGLLHCIANLYPSFLIEQRQAAGAQDAPDEAREPLVKTIDDYVRFTRLLHEDTEKAFAQFDVTWQSLGTLTYAWTRRLAESNEWGEFDHKLWGLPLAAETPATEEQGMEPIA